MLKQATHYSRNTVKPRRNEIFAEEIVSSGNSTKTMQHTIRQLSKVSRLSQTSSVHLKNATEFVMETAHPAKQDEQSFANKSFAKHYKPSSTHYLWSVHRPYSN